MLVPDDIKLLYFLECAFYVHSIYATFCMDQIRKDFIAMIIHHVLTIALIMFSYSTRYHKIGLLVMFFHDISDVIMEFSKINYYIKNRNKKFYFIHDWISKIGLACFSVTWYTKYL